MPGEPPTPAAPQRRDRKDCGGFGRLVTDKLIASGWHCRWCPTLLVQDGYAVVCPTCDGTRANFGDWTE